MGKKIYFLINSLEGGGAERTIVNMSESLSHDHDVTIITLKDVNFYELPRNVEYLPLSHIKSNAWMLLLFPWYVYSFRKLLKKYDTGMSSLEIANFVNILANKKAKIALEISITFFQGFSWFFYKFFIKLLYPKAQKIKVNSEENKSDLAQYPWIQKEVISVIYNPLDREQIEIKKIEPLSTEFIQFIRWKKVFITVWRLMWQKSHKKLIDAFSKVYNELDKNWIYLVVWDGAEKNRLEKQVEDYWLQHNIIFLWAQKNVFKYLNIADYFVYASKIEWFPNVLGEAMACNLPIITSNFKTGAIECILWEYNEDICKDIIYPYYGPNGVLLDLEKYEDNFLEVYKNIDKITQGKRWFDKFEWGKIKKDILQFIW